MKNTLGTILILLGAGLGILLIVATVRSNYQYDNTIYSNWTLADKASTIPQKSDYIDAFVIALQNSGLQGTHDALYFPTPDNSFDNNLQALISLQNRLHAIKTMDENSFQYQSAIQQITAQEQGQAQDMLSVFQNCWLKVHYYYLWNGWLVLLDIIIPLFLIISGIVVLSIESYD